MTFMEDRATDAKLISALHRMIPSADRAETVNALEMVMQAGITPQQVEAFAKMVAMGTMSPSDETLSRVEVIIESKRALVKYTKPGTVQLAHQDNGRTLKIFISEERS